MRSSASSLPSARNCAQAQGRQNILILDPVTMQVVAVGVEPALGAFDVVADAADDAPEPRRVVHFDEMSHFMGGEIWVPALRSSAKCAAPRPGHECQSSTP